LDAPIWAIEVAELSGDLFANPDPLRRPSLALPLPESIVTEGRKFRKSQPAIDATSNVLADVSAKAASITSSAKLLV